ncbi:hypothetical protein CVV38_02185 [Candidatus Peregrinibacteria bacterium HGW-Peregrinibacteria-1]|jgi:hypothetical protein|nr:MAG: hypothetical protein CVV38_02185 [Candidatus Peregrinibacteria bacterium HGW-Peregrinibacteria-1]
MLKRKSIDIGFFLSLVLFPVLLWAFHDTYLGEIFVSFLPWWMGAYVVLMGVFMFLGRGRGLVATCLVVVMAFAGVVSRGVGVEEDRGVGLNGEGSDDLFGDRGLKVLFGNVYYKNSRLNEFEGKFREIDPGVAMFVEFEGLQMDGLSAAVKDFEDSSYAEIGELKGIYANHLFSKYKVVGVEFGGGGAPVVKYEVEGGGLVYSFFVAHTYSPHLPSFYHARNEQLEAIGEFVADCEERCILVGDFNVSPWSTHFKKLEKRLKYNFDLVNDDNGIVEPTWSPDWFPFATVPLDYLFVSKDLEVGQFDLINVPGSDHKAFSFVVAGFEN